jgi:hypothetical protein
VQAIVAKTANFTFALTDAGDLVTVSSTNGTTATIPANATVAFPIGTIIYINNINTGAVTVAAASGVTLASLGSANVLNGSGATAVLFKRATNTWTLANMTRGLR